MRDVLICCLTIALDLANSLDAHFDLFLAAWMMPEPLVSIEFRFHPNFSMKRFIFLLVVFILVGLGAFFLSRPSAETPFSDSGVATSRGSVSSAPPSQSITQVLGGVSEDGELTVGNPEKQAVSSASAQSVKSTCPAKVADVVAAKDDGFVRKVISETWLDPEGKAGRRRVRVVEADFKYPRLRLEEEVWTDPDTGQQTVNRTLASVADHLMIGLKNGADVEDAKKVLVENGYKIRDVEPGSYILAELPVYESANAQRKSITDIEALNEFINYAEPDYLVYPTVIPNDPSFGNNLLWGLDNPGNVAGRVADADIDAPEGWDIRHDASNVIVAVTDTGIQYNHEDLAPNMWSDASGNHGYDAYDDDDDPMDTGGHGTHCAGTIGGRGDNGIGITGVAWKVQLMAGRFLGPNGGSTSDGIKVINYARNHGADIISASWGGGGFSQSLYDAIDAAGDAGIPFVAAAGNSSTDNDSTPHYPSSYDVPTLVAVAATTSEDQLSYFSCYGRYSVDLAAPGSDIWSSYIGSNNTYKHLNGTSMATPHVSGALALAKAQFPEDDAYDLVSRLYSSVDKVDALNGVVATGGRLNLATLLGNSSVSSLGNDDFDSALRFDGTHGYWSGTNKKATREDDEDDFSLPNTGEHSLWFAWKAPFRGLVEFNVVSDYKTVHLIAFRGAEKGELRVAADGGSYTILKDQTIRFYAEAGQEYRFLVDSYVVSNLAYQNLKVKLDLKPSNDFLSDALDLRGDRFSEIGSNVGATAEPFEKETPHAGVGKGKSVWWSWTPEADGPFVITTQGSSFDTVLAVYKKNPFNQSELTRIIDNDDRNAMDWTSQVQFNAKTDTTYYIAVDGYRGDAQGMVVLNGFKYGELAIIKHPENVTVGLGGRAVFDVSVAAAGVTRYQWMFQGEFLPGETESTLVIDPVESGHWGEYSVEVANTDQTLTSNQAELIEKKLPPVIVWNGGDLAVGEGESARLAVKVNGSQPMTYQWYKDGVEVSGQTTTELLIGSASLADSGLYRLDVSNEVGGNSAQFYLSVVSSPWNGWEWRRPSVPNSAISDIKAYDSTVFAIAGNLLFDSADGQVWNQSEFPVGFYGEAFEMLGDRRICMGRGVNGEAKVAVSTSGAEWVLLDPDGLEGANASQWYLSKISDQFILVTKNIGLVYHSSDGISWAVCQVQDDGGGESDLTGSKQMPTNGSLMIMLKGGYSNNDGISYYYTSDGGVWRIGVSHPGLTSFYRYPSSCFYAMGLFHLMGTYSSYTSPDGITWTYQSDPSNGLNSSKIYVADDNGAYALSESASNVIWFNDVSDRMSYGVYPQNVQSFTAGAIFQGKLIYGTDKGNLKMAVDVNDITFTEEKALPIKELNFIDGLFVAVSDRQQYSGDGRVWKYSDSPKDDLKSYSGYAMGRHWGVSSLSWDQILTGYTPYSLANPRNSFQGLNAPVRWIGENAEGTSFALSSTESFYSSLGMFLKAAGGSEWTQVSVPFEFSAGTRFTYLRGRWYLTGSVRGPSWSAAPMYYSENGVNWKKIGVDAETAEMVEMDGSLYIVTNVNGELFVLKSNDGQVWTSLTSSGLPTTYTQISKLCVFNRSLVVLVGETIYYSSDGIGWLKAAMPEKVVDMASGNGQFVVALAGGGIIQTGVAHQGGAAPVVNIQTPQPSSTQLVGANVSVKGYFFDPEDGSVTYRCYVDGVMVKSGFGNQFLFDFSATELTGHDIVVEAEDSQGLKQSSAIHVNVVSATPVNRLTSLEGVEYLPTSHITEMQGVYYVAGRNSLYRSGDGKRWERMELPYFRDSIYSMASGNGTLALQFGNGSILSTRDGVRWSQFSPNQTDYWVRSPLLFQEGRFIAVYQVKGLTLGSVMTSEDGFVWSVGVDTPRGYLNVAYNNDSGVILGSGSYERGIFRSVDGGESWRKLDAFTNDDLYNYSLSFGNGKFVLWSRRTNKVFFSVDGLAWSEQTASELEGFNRTGSLVFVGGRFFAGSETKVLFTFLDEFSAWKSLSTPLNVGTIVFGRGLFVAETDTGLAWSEDGVKWTTIPDGEGPENVANITGSSNGFLVIDDSGAVWTSVNGVDWVRQLNGKSQLREVGSGLGVKITELNGRLILVGMNGLLAYSDDDGLSWALGTINGEYLSWQSHYIRLKASSTSALTTANIYSGRLCRTVDGIHWEVVPDLEGVVIVDFDYNGSLWTAVGKNGEIFQSSDDGVRWTEIPADTLLKGKAIAWFQSKWVIIGAIPLQEGEYDQYHTLTLESDGKLVDHGGVGFKTDVYDLYKTMAHGKMLIWERGAYPKVSSDGTQWTVTNLGAGGGNYSFDVYSTSTGFKALRGSSISSTPVLMWESDMDGEVWNTIPSRYELIEHVDNLGDRVFVFGSGTLYEETSNDVVLTLGPTPEESLGVGDVLNVDIQIENRGGDTPSSEGWIVEAWLSKNDFFGDGNDIYLGRVLHHGLMPAPGDTVTESLGFELPSTLNTGENYVVLRLFSTTHEGEVNRSNNVALSKTPFLTIPEWELNLVTNGNGQVNQNFAAVRYPHKARVSLTANAGKGAAFTGWGGDAIGGESQITILMDGNKSLEAHFSSRASLQVLTRGGGSVSGLADLGSYAVGDVASLTAVPAEGWQFAGWSGAATGATPLASITMDTPKAVTAKFVQTLSNWKSQRFDVAERSDPAVSGDNADPDRDGLKNWQEYLHGSNPKDKRSRGVESLKVEGGWLYVVFTRNPGVAGDYGLDCQATRDMSDWNAPDLQERILSTSNGIETIEARIPVSGGSKGFLRLKYSQ